MSPGDRSECGLKCDRSAVRGLHVCCWDTEFSGEMGNG